MLYSQVAALDLHVEDCEFHRHERDTSSGFTRVTTSVVFQGDGETGRGEDVTYDAEDHADFHDSSDELEFTGGYTLDEFSSRVAETDLFFGKEPGQSVFRGYRRWGFESAALDLALKQAGTDLASRLDEEYSPVRFVVSSRLGEPPTGERVLDWLDRDPALEFKLDPTSAWSAETVDRLAETDAVRTLDLKGQYHGTVVDQAPDPDLYERVLDGFPDALVEDPALTDETRPLFEGHEERVTWDYPIQSVETVEDLPWEPSWLNIKPSRFGSVRSVFDTIEYCQARDIQLFGGGQFELDVGRQHLHALASLLYPDAPNDVAPRGYNDPEPSDNLAKSPLDPPTDPQGLEWA